MSQLFGPLSSGTYAPNSSTYRMAIPWRAVDVTGGVGASTRWLTEAEVALRSNTDDLSPLAVTYLDPADYAVAGLTTKYRVRATCLTNGTAPAITLTVGFYPISASSGAANVIAMTPGTVQSGSTVAFTSPALDTQNQGNSGDFTAPAAGYYALGLVLSGTTAANSEALIGACLQARNA